jgi:hypothetical protein
MRVIGAASLRNFDFGSSFLWCACLWCFATIKACHKAWCVFKPRHYPFLVQIAREKWRTQRFFCSLERSGLVELRMTKSRVCMIFNFLLVFSSALLLAQSSAMSREQVYSALIGEWTGTLEYRDFKSNERVVLPTWLEVKPEADGKSLQFRYTYDDGPTKTVTEQSTITIDPTVRRFTITSDRDRSSDTYQIDPGSGTKQIRLTLTGAGQENGRAVDVRVTVTINRNLYQFRKETRAPGEDFAFRDGYTFTKRSF